MKRKIFISLLTAFFVGGIMIADKVDNAAVIKMVKKGYPTEVITNFLEDADELELTADMEAIDSLMEAGADSELITYIQRHVKKSHTLEAGLYWHNADEQPVQLMIVPLQKKENNFGSKLLGSVVSTAGTIAGVSTGSVGLIGGSWIAGDILGSAGFKSEKLYIPGEHAHVKLNNNEPVFRLVIPEKGESTYDPNYAWYFNWLTGVQSPNEFQLIKLDSKGKGKKANRQFPSNLNWTAGGFSTNNDDSRKNLVEFNINKVKDNIFEIYFDQPLEPGEYIFFYRDAMAENLKGHLSAFDFTVLD